jgi:hypothetical protein
MDGGVRKKDINLTSDNWDLIPLSWVDKDRILSYFEHTKDRSYDWWGLFGSQIVNRRSDLKKASFCSEWCAAAAGLPNPETYNPGTLGEYCKWMESLQKKYV